MTKWQVEKNLKVSLSLRKRNINDDDAEIYLINKEKDNIMNQDPGTTQKIDTYIALLTTIENLKEENARLKGEIDRLKWQIEAQD